MSRPRSYRQTRTPHRPNDEQNQSPNRPLISIDISSDEEDDDGLSSESVRALDGSDASSVSNHATLPLEAKTRRFNGLGTTSERVTSQFFQNKPKITPRTDIIVPSTALINDQRATLCNRLKRVHRTSTEGTSKFLRTNINCLQSFNRSQSDDSSDSIQTADDRVDAKPNLSDIENVTRNVDTCPENPLNANVQETRTEVNIKREVKNEPTNTYSGSSGDDEDNDRGEDTKTNLSFLPNIPLLNGYVSYHTSSINLFHFLFLLIILLLFFFDTFSENLVDNVKVEPVSSTNSHESDNESCDEKPTNLSVLIKQQEPNTEYKNDPEAGPSGIKCEPTTSKSTTENRNQFNYFSDDSDDESSQPSLFWRRPLNALNSHNDTIASVGNSNLQSATNKSPIVVINLIDNEPNSSNDGNEQTTQESKKNNSAIDVLTLPDLQLDWASDSSSEDEIRIRTVTPPRPRRFAAMRAIKSTDNLMRPDPSEDEPSVLPPIDLTVSDTDDESVLNNNETESEMPQMVSDGYSGLMNYLPNIPSIPNRGDSAARPAFYQNSTDGNNYWNAHRPIDLRQPLIDVPVRPYPHAIVQNIQNDNEPRNLSMRYPNGFPVEGLLNESVLGIENDVPIPISIEPNDLSAHSNVIPPEPIIETANPPTAVSPGIIVYERQPSPLQPIDNQNVSGDNPQRTLGEQYMALPPHHHPQMRHQPNSRCPYVPRRMSTANFNNLYSNLRPAYAPHEMLWFRQQNNQEILRRHMMNSMINDPTPSSSFGAYASNRVNNSSGVCVQCDQQHPLGHPHRRPRPHVCPLNLSSENPSPLILR